GGGAPEGPRNLLALAYRKRYRLERVEMRKETVDLEGADEAAADPRLGAECRDVLAAEQDLAAVRPQHAGHQVDQRGFAGSVRADECVANALWQRDADLVGDHQRAEPLVESAGRKRGCAHASRLHGGGDVSQPNQRWPFSVFKSRERPPRMPFGRNSTT